MQANKSITHMQRMMLLGVSNSIRKLMGQPTVQTYPLIQEREDLYYLTTRNRKIRGGK